MAAKETVTPTMRSPAIIQFFFIKLLLWIISHKVKKKVNFLALKSLMSRFIIFSYYGKVNFEFQETASLVERCFLGKWGKK